MSENSRKKAADRVEQWLKEENVDCFRDFADPGVIYLPEFYVKHSDKKDIKHDVRLSCDISQTPYLCPKPGRELGIEGIHVQVSINLHQGLRTGQTDNLAQFVVKVCNLTNPYFKYVRTSKGGIMMMDDIIYDEISFQHMMYKIVSYAATDDFIKSEKFGGFLDECLKNGYEVTDELLQEHFGIYVEKVMCGKTLN